MDSIVNTVLSHTPATWVEMTNTADVECFELDEDDREYGEVSSRLCGIEPDLIHRVQNPFLWGCYLLRRDEYTSRRGDVEEHYLWHATGADKVPTIVRDNFDWRRTKRALFGKGVSFSPDPVYADKYCNDKNGASRALLLCKVLVGDTCIGHRGMVVPKDKYDTSIRKNKKVFVKYMDYEFYPAYVVYYNHNSSLH